MHLARRLLCALALTCMALGATSAAAASEDAGQPLLRTFNAVGHPASGQNWAIVQDRRGVMYFGSTDDGVLEYDGVNWRAIKTPNRTTIRSLALGQDGRIYVGAIGEIGYLESDAAGRMHYVSLLERVPAAERDFADVWSTFATSEGIYFTTFKRVIRIAAKTTRVWNAGSSFHIAQMARGRLYLREVGRGLLELVDDELQLVAQGERLATEKVAAVLPWPDADGSDRGALLIATRTQGWYLLRDGRMLPWRTEVDAELARAQIYNAIRLSDGRLALGTLQGGALLLDAQGRLAGRLDKGSGLQSPTVYNLFEDRQGSLWLALDKGLGHAEVSGALSYYGALAGVEGSVITMHRHAGILYLGTTQGLYRLEPAAGGSGRFVAVPQVSGQTWDLVSMDDALLVGGADGVHELRGGRWRMVRPSTQNTVSLARSRINPERVFVGLMNGLATMRLQDGRWIDEGIVPGIDEEVRSIVQEQSGRIWLGTLSSGVLALGPEAAGTTAPLSGSTARRFRAEQGLPVGPVFVHRVQGQPAFATTRGVYRFDDTRAAFVPDARYAALFGEPPRQVFPLVEDARGGVWMYSQDDSRTLKESGVARPTEGAGGLAYRWDPQPLAELTGLAQATFLADGPNALWVGGDEGVYRLDRRPRTAAAPARALVRKVAGRDGSLHFAGGGQHATPALDFERNALRFEFAAPTFERRAPRYQAMLEGLDRGWSPPMTETYLDYTNLREGDYRFRVRAIDALGRVGPEDAFAFRIRPPWTRTPLAYLAYVLLGGLTLLALAGWRSAALRARNRDLAQLVDMRTRELSEANSALQQANTSLAEISLTDALTGLKNRRYLAERIAEDMAVLRRAHTQAEPWAGGTVDESQLVFIMVDIDHFKHINDQYGHAAGDRVLEQFGTILRSVCRDTDTAVRWGGEEFLLVARHTSIEAGMVLAERIRTQVAAHPFVVDDGRVLHRSCSLGFAPFPLDPDAPQQASWELSVKLADQCLYEAKRGGRNAWVGVRAGAHVEADSPMPELAQALAAGRLVLLRMPELARQAAPLEN